MTASWPLIAYTLCSVIACGTLGVQGVLALGGRGARIQTPGALLALVFAVLAAVFACLRVGRLDRVFNVFGHPASPVAQTFIAILALIVVSLVYLVALRRAEEEGEVPLPVAALGVLASLFGVYAVAAGDVATSGIAAKTALAVALVAGSAALVGTLACRALLAVREREAAAGGLGVATVACGLASGVATVAFSLVAPTMVRKAVSITTSTYGFESAHPTQATGSQAAASAASGAMGDPLFWVVVVAVGIVIPLVVALLTRKRSGVLTGVLCGAAALCVLVGLAYAMDQFMFTSSVTRLFG
ncbi:MAG: polysulfide reductase NrfD [Coriobacteriia bacterium]|nr:polysulfide reductase NrfD [Coriobacteriia bacterium]MBS5477326.1 polysulfide reductase NrfD [Coriobacteriia bacterium]